MILGAHALGAVALGSGPGSSQIRLPVSEARARSWRTLARLDLPWNPPGLFTQRIPISSFQYRMNAAGMCYLSVVIPAPEPWAVWIDFISSHGGRLYLERSAYDAAGALIVTSDIAEADIESLRTDTGSRSSSVSIEARSELPEAGYPFPIPLSGASYRNTQNGIRRYRCRPHNSLRPGDTVQVNGEEFVIGEISCYGSASQEVMEVAEVEA